MKKWMRGLAVGLLAVVLVACSNDPQKPADTKPGTDEVNKSELTLEEVFNKAQEASENIKSMHADMEMKQNISMPELEEEMETSMDIKMDIIQDPLSMYQVMKMEIPEMGGMEIEMYVTEAGIFMKNPEGEEWMKLPADSYDDIMEGMNSGAEANIDFETLGEFIEDFTFEQDDNQYILKLKASGEEFKKIVEEQLDAGGLMEGLGEEEQDVLNDMKIHELEYEIFIDKETFQTIAFNLDMDIELTVEEGETFRMKQELEAKMSQINDISEIIVPQEIIDQAIEY